jgi:hypothetical protein
VVKYVCTYFTQIGSNDADTYNGTQASLQVEEGEPLDNNLTCITGTEGQDRRPEKADRSDEQPAKH